MRYGHFEIDMGPDGHPVELGAGAMATTYRAQDSVLHSAVALKVINQKMAEHPSARARFLREARAAAKLHHPNVASVSHYGEQDGECYYVMELVEGETLEARVRREGPLPPSLALEIGVQVARALAAAEACGVVHRDLKPSNIMLTTSQGEKTSGTASTVVKVIDWGLAKAVSAESALGIDHTHGGFVGTPAFASPEQFARTEGQQIDHRSDIYSLGVTLWYLLCGRTPFTGTTLEEIHSRQTQNPPPLEQLSAVRVPGRVVTLLKSMLAVDPAARAQSARELLDALRGCQKQFPLEASPPQTRRRLSRWITGALVLLAACGVAGWVFLHRAPIAPADRSVAVLPFENLSPEAADAFFTTGVQDQIGTDLAHVASLKVIGSDSTRFYPPGGRDLARIGKELGVAYFLEGSVRRAEGQVAINVRLVNARDSSRAWANQYNRPLADVFAVQSEITHAVAARLQAPLTSGERAAITELPTSDLAAYDFYLRARDGISLVPNSVVHREEQHRKIALLEKAVARDQGFFLAYCDLATAHDRLYEKRAEISAEEMSVDHRAVAEGYLATARRLRPDDGRLHLAQAYHYFITPANADQARIEVDLARRSLPNDQEVEYLAAVLAVGQGRWEEGVRSFEHAVALAPRSQGNVYGLAQVYRFLRRYEDFERAIAKTLELTPERERAAGGDQLEIAMGAVEGRADLAPLRAALANFPATNDQEIEKKDIFSLVLCLDDHDPDALSRLLAGSARSQFTVYGVKYPRAWFEALAARMRGDEAGARTSFAVARPEMEKQVLAFPSNVRLLSTLAIIDAGLGRKEALDEVQRLRTMTIYPANRPGIGCNVAVVYAWLGQPDLALAELEKWLNEPASGGIQYLPTYGDFRLNPLWDPLRGNSRFEAIVQHFAPPNRQP